MAFTKNIFVSMTLILLALATEVVAFETDPSYNRVGRNIQGRRLLSKVLAMIKGAKEFVAPFRKPIKGAFKVGKAVTCKEYCPPNVDKNTCIVCPNN
ncbi:hypothetical protein MRB53_023443 [Persea americana]|uniref:Uncharacterized protein n=1 Tax=Persea americana TaxID=3435 RepID=A0ACC2L9L3_PERAE|nr:hypothetical protein MRB53_023443 [Persea americana]